MFLSANNFFWKITIKHGDVMTRVGQWRDLGRPEAALIGVQYLGNDARRASRRRGSCSNGAAAPLALRRHWTCDPGSTFASGGIEVDETTPNSPPGIEVLGAIPNLFGTGHDAR